MYASFIQNALHTKYLYTVSLSFISTEYASKYLNNYFSPNQVNYKWLWQCSFWLSRTIPCRLLSHLSYTTSFYTDKTGHGKNSQTCSMDLEVYNPHLPLSGSVIFCLFFYLFKENIREHSVKEPFALLHLTHNLVFIRAVSVTVNSRGAGTKPVQ